MKYTLLQRIIHWITAFMIIGMLIGGFYMTSIPRDANLYYFHKAFGVLILFLAFLRIANNSLSPKLKPQQQGFLGMAGKGGHHLLYLMLFIMPVSGMFMTLFYGLPISFFKIFVIPPFTQNLEFAGIFKFIHFKSAIILAVVLCGHVFMAFVHHFLLKDNTFRRMV